MSAFFIIDTHVVVAGLLASHVESPVARILDGMLSAIFACVVSEALLAEYRAVLLLPKLCKLHGLSEPDVDIILTDIARHAIVLTLSNDAKVTSSAPDPGDQFLWNLLHARADLVLVTGDKLLLADVAMQQRVISPQAFIAQLTH